MKCKKRYLMTDTSVSYWLWHSKCCRMVAFIAKVCYVVGKDVMFQGRCIFAPHFPSTCNGVICARQAVCRRLSTKQQASVPFSAQVRTFHAQLLILIVNFLQYYQKEINLEHGNNCSDGELPNIIWPTVQWKKPTVQLDEMCRKDPEVWNLPSNSYADGYRKIAVLRICYCLILAAKRCQIFIPEGGKIYLCP